MQLPLARALAAWLLILALAILNGALREAVLLPRLGNPAAQLASGVILIVVILAVARLLIPRHRNRGALFAIGALWLLLTLAFEFGFGHYAQGKAWRELLGAYAFRDGNIWPLVLLATLFAPMLASRRRGAGRVR